MLANDYPLGFKVELHRKDLGIALDLAARLGAVLPVTALAAQLETGLIAGGHAEDDMSALARAIRALSALESPRRTGAGTPISRDRRATSARQASRRTAA